MHPKEIESVLSLPKEKRYKTFLLRVSDNEKLWVLAHQNHDFYYEHHDSQPLLPIWPEKTFAQLYASEKQYPITTYPINLETFLYQTIPNLIEKRIPLSLFPKANHQETIILTPQDLAAAIVNHLDEWYGESFELPYLENNS